MLLPANMTTITKVVACQHYNYAYHEYLLPTLRVLHFTQSTMLPANIITMPPITPHCACYASLNQRCCLPTCITTMRITPHCACDASIIQRYALPANTVRCNMLSTSNLSAHQCAIQIQAFNKYTLSVIQPIKPVSVPSTFTVQSRPVPHAPSLNASIKAGCATCTFVYLCHMHSPSVQSNLCHMPYHIHSQSISQSNLCLMHSRLPVPHALSLNASIKPVPHAQSVYPLRHMHSLSMIDQTVPHTQSVTWLCHMHCFHSTYQSSLGPMHSRSMVHQSNCLCHMHKLSMHQSNLCHMHSRLSGCATCTVCRS
jgi:hypothetical protein